MGGFAHHMFTTRKKFYGIRRHDLLIQCFFVEQITIEKVRKNITHSLIKVAGATGLEPATSCVTGRSAETSNPIKSILIELFPILFNLCLPFLLYKY